MKKGIRNFVAVAAFTTFTAAIAGGYQEPVAHASDTFFNNSAAGVYVGADVGYGHINNNDIDSSNRGSFAWDVNLGYQFVPAFALEVGYLGIYDRNIVDAGAGGDVTIGGFDLLAKGIFALNEQFNLFAKAGVLRSKMELSNTQGGAPNTSVVKYVPLVGVGLGYNLTHALTVNAQYLYVFQSSTFNDNVPGGTINGRIPSAHVFLAGLSYKFSTY